jgi:hypothetical protein
LLPVIGDIKNEQRQQQHAFTLMHYCCVIHV